MVVKKIFALAFAAVTFLTADVFGQVSDFAHTDFKKADSIAALYPDHALTNLYGLALKLTTPLPTQEEKFRAIYKWVCNNIANDYSLFTRNQRQRNKLKDEALKDWNGKVTALVFENLLEKHQTVCTGYAYLIRELATHAGLVSVIVDGYGRTLQANIGGTGMINHSWNAIQLYNKWYLCDATWSSGAIDRERAAFIKNYDDAYFLAHPSLFIRNHYPLDSTMMLLRDKPTLSQFLKGPVTYTTIYQYNVTSLQPETFEITTTKGSKVTFRFLKDPQEEIKEVALSLKGSGLASSVYVKPYIDAVGFTCIDHTFVNKGTYTVHFLFNNRAAFTYVVKVK